MISSLWSTRLLHLGWGFAFYVILQAWGILAETTASGTPGRRSPGASNFALGQSVAITALLALALMCGRILSQTLQTHGIEFIALWCSGLLVFTEGAAAAFGSPLVSRPVAIKHLDFTAGRDLIVRHGSPLFLGLATTSAWLGPTTSSMVAGGCIVAWGCTQMLGGPRQDDRIALWTRRMAAILGLGMTMVFFRAAWTWTF